LEEIGEIRALDGLRALIEAAHGDQYELPERLERTALNAEGVAGGREAQLLCLMMRVVEPQTSKTVTSAMTGIFRHYTATRTEFLELVGHR